MTTIQAVLLGIELALTPSALLLAALLWRDENHRREHHDHDR
jgi:hypothetical protein